jgi:4-hydroxy-tetrahydrodipicolinate reductase
MNPPVSIAVHGASGRMGQAILRLAFERPQVRVVAAIVKAGAADDRQPLRARFGEAAPDVACSSSLDQAAVHDVLVDFSSADAFDGALAAAVSRGIAFASGTTGLSQDQRAAIRRAGTTIPVLWSANFSIGVAVLTRLAREAARALRGWDCEVAEAHHRHKKDAPSGTALALGRAVADARGEDFEKVARFDRTAATGAREPSAIGFAVVRGGDIVGEHSVIFAGEGERIELTHRASDRDVFARGALDAALWLAGRPPGTYALSDILDP